MLSVAAYAGVTGIVGALDYYAARYLPLWTGRALLALTVVPPLALLVFAAIEFGLAIATNDRRYAFADRGFGIAVIIAVLWVPPMTLGFVAGRRHRAPDQGRSTFR